MFHTVRQLSIGLGLIAACVVVLLLSDLDGRVTAGEHARANRHGKPKVAVIQPNAQWIFDAGVAGIVAGLEESGFHHGQEIQLRKFNSMGDSNLANAIAREATDGGYDLIVTVTTVSLQVVANINRARRIPHLFALVSIPSELGVGVSELDPLNHPPYLSGYGTRLPAAQAIRIAREINPSLRRIGTVWNQSEKNSEVQIRDARQLCKELGMELIEANVDNTGSVAEATASILSRKVDAFFIPGDITVMPAIHNVIELCHRNGVPTFTIFPTDIEKGILFGIGADYFEVGRQTGKLASEVLRGRNIATIPVTDYMPEKISLNEQARLRLPDPERWAFPDDLMNRAHFVVDPKGKVIALKGDAPPATATPSPEPSPARP